MLLSLLATTPAQSPSGVRDLEAAAEGGSAIATARLILDRLEDDREQARSWIDRLLKTGNLAEIRRVGSFVLERQPEGARDWAELGVADKSDEVRAVVADLVRAVDPELADSLLPKAAT